MKKVIMIIISITCKKTNHLLVNEKKRCRDSLTLYFSKEYKTRRDELQLPAI